MGDDGEVFRMDRYWMYETINNSLKDMFYDNPKVAAAMPDYEKAVLDGKIDSFSAAGELLKLYRE